MKKHPGKFCEKEGVKVGEAAAGGVTATAVCNVAAKVLAPCLKSAPEAAMTRLIYGSTYSHQY